MTSLERVKLALNHKEPDRVPFDLGSTLVTGISVRAFKKYLEHTNKDISDIRISDLTQQLADVPEKILEELKVDTRGLWPGNSSIWSLKITEEDRYKCFTDEWGIVWKMPKEGGFYYDMQVNPLASIDTIEGLKKYSWPDPTDPNRFKGLREKAQKIVDSGYALMMGNMTGGSCELPGWLRGFENWYCDLVAAPQYAEALLDITNEIQYEYVRCMLEEIGDLITVYVDSQDFGTQNGPLISIDMFRKYVKPRIKKIYDLVKSKSKAKVFVHSCGSVYELLPEFIEAGVDILNPVQISAAKMDSAKLKKEFGRDLVFWGGGVDTQQILPHGTPQQVKDCVRRQIEALAPGGGFVFNTVHNIQADVPPQNLEAMLEAFDMYCKY